jgi:tRNA pseudouridine38-40 synthase
MERNVRLVIAYDGTDFHGWQTQPGWRTVQEEVEQVLRRVVRHPLLLTGASRTDAGVHARGQVANLLTDCPMPVDNLRRAVKDRLPEDVTLVHAAEVPADFHATRGARAKLYRYAIWNTRDTPAVEAATRYAWHVWHALDLEAMRAAAADLVGRHDFAAFANKGSPRESTVRTVTRIGVQRRYQRVWIEVEGDGFLYNQVRIMVGTLVEIGRGHWPAARAAEILASCDRGQAGRTAPAHGLCLEWVRYGATSSR